MHIERSKIVYLFYQFIDIVIIAATFYTAYYLRLNSTFFHDALYIDFSGNIRSLYIRYAITVILNYLIISRFVQFYISLRFYSYPQLFIKITKLLFLTCVSSAFIIFFIFRDMVISRYFVIYFYALFYVVFTFEKFCMKFLVNKLRKKSYNAKNILIIGCDDRAVSITEEIYKHLEWGYSILGYLYFNKSRISKQIDDHKILGDISKLEEIFEKYIVDEVLFVANRQYIDSIDKYIQICETQGKTIRIYLDIFEGSYISKFRPELLGHIPVFTFHTISFSYSQQLMKRFIDFFLGFAGFLFFILLYIIFAPIILLTSRGPVLFRQKRIGMNNREINIYKFRTMYKNAEQSKKDLIDQNELNGAVFKMKNDPRVTPIGRFLRKTSIDEFPQFINVLKGEMSIVGTRPPTPEEVAKYDKWHRRRFSIKPGISGLWQVSGRNKITDFDDIVRLDLEYADNWSIMLDLKIILKTIIEIFRRGGY